MKKDIEKSATELELLAVDLRRIATELDTLSKTLRKLDEENANQEIRDNHSKLRGIFKGMKHRLKELVKRGKTSFKRLIAKAMEESN